VKKVIIRLLIFTVIFFHSNSVISQNLEKNFKKQQEDMLKTILLHSSMLESKNIEISEKVLKAMQNVPRHKFVPQKLVKYAYEDRPLGIGFGQTISQPFIVSLMTELLDINDKSVVLEIGTGSGYQAAILAEMEANIYSVEIIPELVERASKVLNILYPEIKLRVGDGYFGWEKYAPFDGIIVTAAVDHIPEPLTRQLKVGGKIVIPIGSPYTVQELIVVEKKINDDFILQQILPVRFVPLTGDH
jgi:protein-L-isoaspartate(D-aspartate) O-methyltransferase